MIGEGGRSGQAGLSVQRLPRGVDRGQLTGPEMELMTHGGTGVPLRPGIHI